MKTDRPNIDTYMMRFAFLSAERSTCLKKCHGAVLVKDKQIIATGYNGAARTQPHCTETGVCLRESAAPGTEYEKCVAVHSEMNAICQAARHGIAVSGATLYVTGIPCVLCARLLINVGISCVHYVDDGRYSGEGLDLLRSADINLRMYVLNEEREEDEDELRSL